MKVRRTEKGDEGGSHLIPGHQKKGWRRIYSERVLLIKEKKRGSELIYRDNIRGYVRTGNTEYLR